MPMAAKRQLPLLAAAAVVLLLCSAGLTDAKKDKGSNKAGRASRRGLRVLTTRNGMRLLGRKGDRTKNSVAGRLEIATKAFWVDGTNDGAKVAWRPVCADYYSDDTNAEFMCNLLGYDYGRSFYSAATNHLPPPTSPGSWGTQPVGYLGCSSLGVPPEADPAAATGGSGMRRSLLSSPLRGDVEMPEGSGYACDFRMGECGDVGPIVALQCSNVTFRPAPPPPPTPPSPSPPPPRAPAFYDKIRLEFPESNLRCAASPDNCFGQRVEVLLPAPAGSNGSEVWAPLCADPNNATYGEALYDMVCKQAYDWPFSRVDRPGKGGFFAINGQEPTSGPSYNIPKAPYPEGSFNPTTYAYYASLPANGSLGSATNVQALKPTLSATACTNGLLAVQCAVVPG